MNKGKSTCKILKDIRQKIADANGIRYVPKECNFKGECKGTCPACEAEIRYLEDELRRKQRNGFAVKIGGIAAGLCAMVVPAQVEAQNINKDSLKTSVPQVNALDSVAVKDLSEGAEDAIVVRGCLISNEDKEPLIGASVIVLGTQKGLATDLDGNFAVKVPQDANLKISFIGCKDKIIKAKDLLDKKNRTIVLENDESSIQGEVVVVGGITSGPRDDVYNRTTPKYKSHKKKCKK
ncbi:carboxypeptidase-like regulatory domain-containing protein [Prevotella intermedia]|uniref:Membrane receptor RagA n=1 Tax=Prevotella intermedia TaxID=28131 RepID=A0A2M8MAN8_PREIN|nr:carboxypeptidase-like regulatory domain-containing protein [Prevotella intermedia]PJF01220.1 membrane receptor RagA [Prevotella intermedia]